MEKVNIACRQGKTLVLYLIELAVIAFTIVSL